MKVLTLVLVSFILSGCTADGSISGEDKNKEFSCFDSRDYTTFLYNTNTMKNIRIGTDGSRALFSMDIVTRSGKAIYIDQDIEALIECVEVKTGEK